METRVYTIGHGNKVLQELVDMLEKNHIDTLVDVRSYPRSKRNPHFNGEAMEISLPEAGDIDWWRKNRFDPAEALQKLRCPVLSLFAEYDALVPPQENRDKMERYLKAAGIEYRIKTIPGCGHNMIGFHGLNGNNWDWPHVYWQWMKQPVEFMDEIVGFIKREKVQ